MIKSFKTVKLNQRISCDLQFHEDINIVTGKNGSGKTTLLKLLWYAISGNLERIMPEIGFNSFEIVTDELMVRMAIESRQKRRIVKLQYRVGDVEKEFVRPVERSMEWEWDDLQEANRAIVRVSGASIFFPTFRRIEGGFSIATHPDEDIERFMRRRVFRPSREALVSRESRDLQQAINNLSERLSVGSHRFVASISTDDIVRLLMSKYAEISERTNRLHMDLSRFILQRVGGEITPDSGTAGTMDETESKEALADIQQRARNVVQESEALLRPFTVLSDLIAKIFQYKGIKLADPITLGEAREAIASEVLSSGEKQMLSFLCYNAFANQACLFIDEPEISLHVDWQRILFPVLLQQSAGNQFIVATHSPFIYSKYSDKELMLSQDRGSDDADTEDDRIRNHYLSR